MKTKKASFMIMVFVLMVILTLAMSLIISGNVSAHAPAKVYLSYKADSETLTVYIDHASDDPNTHYIKTVTVTLNRVEVLSETYASQELSEKGLVTYSYTVAASEGDYISVTAECSIEGSATETITIGESDGKDDPKDDPKGELSTISGVVTDAKSGDPIVGAIVSVYNKDNNELYYKSQTGQRGYYELEVAAGNYTISISMAGYISHSELIAFNKPLEYNVKLTPGSDSNDKVIDDSKKDYTGKDGDPDQKGVSNQDDEDLVLLLGAIIGVLVVIVILIALLLKKEKGTTGKGATKKDKIKNDEWTSCPKCGSSLRMGQLSSHLDTVHPKLSKTAKDRMIERVTKPK